MKIRTQPIIYTNYPQKNLNFTSNRRAVFEVINGVKVLSRKNSSLFFKQDINWAKLADMFIDKYKDINKVHTQVYACSDGAEAFSLAMILLEKLGPEKAKKFFPIIASDIDDEILKNPSKGIIKLSKEDIKNIKDVIGENYKKYIKFDNNFAFSNELHDTVCTGRIMPILKNTVIFKKANIEEDIYNIEKDNSIILGRNFWSYIRTDEKKNKLAQIIAQNLGKNSIYIAGSTDIKYNALLHLKQAGLEMSETNYCFTQPNKKFISIANPNFLMLNYAKVN